MNLKKNITIGLLILLGLFTIISLTKTILIFPDFQDNVSLLLSASFSSSILICLSSLLIIQKKELKTFAYFGFSLSFLGIFSSSLYLINLFDYVDKLTIVTISIINIAVTHTALLLTLRPKFKIVRIITIITLISISIASFILIHILNGNLQPEKLYIKIFSVFLLFNIIGSILSPIFNTKKKSAL